MDNLYYALQELLDCKPAQSSHTAQLSFSGRHCSPPCFFLTNNCWQRNKEQESLLQINLPAHIHTIYNLCRPNSVVFNLKIITRQGMWWFLPPYISTIIHQEWPFPLCVSLNQPLSSGKGRKNPVLPLNPLLVTPHRVVELRICYLELWPRRLSPGPSYALLWQRPVMAPAIVVTSLWQWIHALLIVCMGANSLHWNLSMAEEKNGYRSSGISGMSGHGQNLPDETGCVIRGTAQVLSFHHFLAPAFPLFFCLCFLKTLCHRIILLYLSHSITPWPRKSSSEVCRLDIEHKHLGKGVKLLSCHD